MNNKFKISIFFMALFGMFSCSKLEEALRTSNPHQDPAPIPKKPRILSGIFVDSSSTAVGPQKNGKTWANAYNTIQEAVDNASNGSSIIIAKGDYLGNIDFDNKSNLNITGGYAVGDTLEKDFIPDDFKADADWVTINGSMTIKNGSSNIAFVSGLRFVTTLDRAVKIEGTNDRKISNITLNNAKFAGNIGANDGKGMDVKHANDLHLSYVSFANLSDDSGGCLNIENSQNITILSSNFKECMATVGSGGALKIADSNFIKISASTFDSCFAEDFGGIIYFDKADNTTIQSSNFLNSYSKIGGAISFIDANNFRAENISFQNNLSELSGGAVFLGDAKNVIFEMGALLNTGNQSPEGGVFYLDNIENLTINNGNFDKNKSIKTGGVIYAVNITEKINLSNNKFTTNTAEAGNGGAIAFKNNNALIDLNNNKFIENTSDEKGGAISIVKQSNEVYFTDNIFEGNKAIVAGGALYLEANDPGKKSRYIVKGQNSDTSLFKENHSEAIESGGAIYLLSNNNQYVSNAYELNNVPQDDGTFAKESTKARLIIDVAGIFQGNTVANSKDNAAGNFGISIAVKGIPDNLDKTKVIKALKKIAHYKKALITEVGYKEIHPIKP